MTGNNKVLTERQIFRMGVLENSAFAIMLAPYIAISFAGKFHMLALAFGLGFFLLFGWYIYRAARRCQGSFEEVICFKHGTLGKVAGIIYYLRFLFRVALAVLFLGKLISTYMLVNFNYMIIVVSFLLVCFYGASKSLVGRARMMELLFLWMVIPLILMAVFSVNSVKLTGNLDFTIPFIDELDMVQGFKIFAGGYGILLLLQSIELMLFTLDHSVTETKGAIQKIIIWISVSVALAYIFIVGILGKGWASSEPMASFNVMEAATFPGNAFNRLDYLILAFLMIGVFANVSGYIFGSRRILECLTCHAPGWWRKLILFITLFLMLGLWNVKELENALYIYIFFVDMPLAIILPLVVYTRYKLGEK